MRHNHFDLERNQLYREIAIQLGLPREEIRPEASLQRDLGIDSLDTLELVDALEQHFDVRVPDAALAKIETVADLEHQLGDAGADEFRAARSAEPAGMKAGLEQVWA